MHKNNLFNIQVHFFESKVQIAMAKLGNMVTMLLLGYEANNAINQKEQENSVTHYRIFERS